MYLAEWDDPRSICRGGLYTAEVYQQTVFRTFRDVCKDIGMKIKNTPVCIETGSTFRMPYQSDLVDNTTLNLYQYIVEPRGGVLYSLDKDPQCEKIVKDLCGSKVIFLLGDSVQSIEKLPVSQIDVLCLDSAENSNHMVNEYMAAKDKLAEEHIVLVDDVHNPSSVKYKKMVPLLKELEYEWFQVPTPTGLFVAWKGFD